MSHRHLDSIHITDYQSHKATGLELGKFTVIVGQSSSGKSAVVRALKTLAQNSRGTSYVRHGQKQAKVFVAWDDMGVSVIRGAGASEYRVFEASSDPREVYTKCGTDIPDAVRKLLPFGDGDLWLAGQFDRPFLLDETGSAVAKTLGDLTNVSLIFAAVRECNRRAAEHKRVATDRAGQLDQTRETLKDYASLPQQLIAQERAEIALQGAQDLTRDSETLNNRIVRLERGQEAVTQLRAQLMPAPDAVRMGKLAQASQRLTAQVESLDRYHARITSARVAPAPDVTRMTSLVGEFSQLVSRARKIVNASQAVRDATEAHALARDESELTQREFRLALQKAGSCPLCGTQIT